MINILSLIGDLLSFIGTILLSAGLIKSKEEISDVNASYWDYNPYTTYYDLNSQKYYRIGFRLLITGFSIVASIDVGKLFIFKDSSTAILLISISLSSIGLLIIQLFENKRELNHKNYKTKINSNLFFKRLKRILTESRSLASKDVEVTESEFMNFKDSRVSTIKDQQNSIDEAYLSDIEELIIDLDRTKEINSFMITLQDYLQDNKLIDN